MFIAQRSVVLVFLLAALVCESYLAAAPVLAPKDDASIDEPLQRLTPKLRRTEADEDRIAAAALYAHGRVLMQRQDFAGALRRMQRAWRLDPESTSILTEIVPLAFELKRSEEAARYAILSAELDPKDAATTFRLAAYLVDQKESERAAGLYEKALALKQDVATDGAMVLLHLEMGRHYLEEEKKERAAEAFLRARSALTQADGSKIVDQVKRALGGKAEILFGLLGDGLVEAGKPNEAAEIYRQANEFRKNEDLLAYRMARVDFEKSDYTAALEKLNRYFDANISEAGTAPYELLGKILTKRSFDEAAARAELLKRLEKLYEQFRTNVPLAFSYGEELRHAKQWGKTRGVYEELLKQQNASEVYLGLAEAYRALEWTDKLLGLLGQAMTRGGSFDAIPAVRKLVVEDKPLLEKLFDLARDQKQANPSKLPDGAAWAVAQLALHVKNMKVADEFIELALQGSSPPRPQMMFAWGLQLFAAEEADRAAKVFQRAIDEKVLPENNQAFYYYLSGSLAFAKRHDEALEAARKAVAAGQKSARFQSRVAWIAYHAKKYDQADKEYRAILKEYDNDYSSAEVRDSMREIRLILSNISVYQKRMPEAEEWLEQVLDEFPEDIGAMNDLGYLWADQGKHLNRAHTMLKRAVAAEPDNHAYRDSLGWVLYRLGRFEEAVKELEQAVESEDTDGVVLDHLADAYAKLDRRKQAIETWKKAVKSFQKDGSPDAVEKANATTAKIKALEK